MRSSVCVYNVERLVRPGGSALARALGSTARTGWTEAACRAKVAALGAVLRAACPTPPALLCLIEVDGPAMGRAVAKAAGFDALVDVRPAHERVTGYDVALLYDPACFPALVGAASFTIHNRYGTRDILRARLADRAGHELEVLCVHWPSRRQSDAGVQRIAASYYLRSLVESCLKFRKDEVFAADGTPRAPSRARMLERWRTPLLLLGDFNDNPWDASVTMLDATRDEAVVRRAPRLPRSSGLRAIDGYLQLTPRLANPCWRAAISAGDGDAPGTYFYDEWHWLDQIVCSAGWLEGGPPLLDLGSVRAPRLSSLPVDGRGPVRVADARGAPLAFDPATREGASDHLPVTAVVELA